MFHHYVNQYRRNWRKKNLEEYPFTLELDAARDALAEEDTGNPVDVLVDSQLHVKSPQCYPKRN